MSNCFTSTETIRTVRDGEPRTATSTFAQLLSSANFKFNVALRPQRPYNKDYYGRGAQDGHLHFHTVTELCEFKFNVALRPQRPYNKDY